MISPQFLVPALSWPVEPFTSFNLLVHSRSDDQVQLNLAGTSIRGSPKRVEAAAESERGCLGTKTLAREHVKDRTSTCKVVTIEIVEKEFKWSVHSLVAKSSGATNISCFEEHQSAVPSLPPQHLLKPGAKSPSTYNASFNSLRPRGSCRSHPLCPAPQHCLEGTLSRMFPRRAAQRRQDDSYVPSGRPRIRRLRKSRH